MHETKNQAMNPSKCECNDGVLCDVTNCFYHDGTQKCTAEQILVGPSYAVTGADTNCSTFKRK